MLSNLSSTNPIRVTPTASVPTATTITPGSPENQERSDTVRAVNVTEKVENTRPDQTRRSSNQAEIVAQLNPDEQRVVQELQSRDREVRAHEQAHLSAAGSLASGGASFTYQQGPDGQRYAVGGEVGINSASVPGDPQATIQRAEQLRRAALAPASPSAQDRSVAANASSLILEAQAELTELRQSERGQSAVDAFNSIEINADEDNKPTPGSEPIDTFV